MRHCRFRPASFAEAEAGCPLTHCHLCGGHLAEGGEGDDEGCGCDGATKMREHDRRLAQALEGHFQAWVDRAGISRGTTDLTRLREAFAFGAELALGGHVWDGGPAGCGQPGCPECDPPEEDPMGTLEDYE